MEESLEIPVEVRGVERVLQARVQAWRYGVRFLVDVDGQEVVVEKDESGEYRAVLPDGFEGRPPDLEVIKALVAVLRSISE